MRQAAWGWAGNNGQMGWVGETTASSHLYRRYRIVVVDVVIIVAAIVVMLSGRVVRGVRCLRSQQRDAAKAGSTTHDGENRGEQE